MANPEHVRILVSDGPEWDRLVRLAVDARTREAYNRYELTNYPIGPRPILDVRGAHLDGADLSGRVFTGVDLKGASLENSILRKAELNHADLRGANLRSADLSGAQVHWADLSA
jgi:uncharacterized protein YjbI with pentapeptide repeats